MIFIKIVLINGSPRKNFNTVKILQKIAEGAENSGAETKIINLFDYKFVGCKSCFACKLKNSKTNGICAIRDDLRPILEETLSADGFVIGTPIYFGAMTGQTKNFFERLAFPNLSYEIEENGEQKKLLQKKIPTAFVCTMGAPQDYFEKFNYETLLGINGFFLQHIFGDNENLYVNDTYQFTDYSKYAMNDFIAEHKKEMLEKKFPQDLQNAFELGQRLAKKILGE